MELNAIVIELCIVATIASLAVAICIRRCTRKTATVPPPSHPPHKSEEIEVVVVVDKAAWSIAAVPASIEPGSHEPGASSAVPPVAPDPSMDHEQPPPTVPSSSKAEAEKIPVVCGVASDIGDRRSMEDAHLVVFDQACSEGSPTMDAVVGIFDGHGGCQSSAFVADNFSRFLAEQEDCSHEEAIRGAFARCDTELWRRFDDDGSTLDASGTTALVAAVVDQKMLVANLGDSRAVLCTNGRAQQITTDHKPQNERERVIRDGGHIDADGYLNGELGVSRALGDCHLESVVARDGSGPLIPVPELTIREIAPLDDFLILACDGLWDVMSNQRACDMVRKLLVEGSTPEKAARELVDEALLQGSLDNVTVAVVSLRPLPLPPRKVPPRKLTNSRLRRA